MTYFLNPRHIGPAKRKHGTNPGAKSKWQDVPVMDKGRKLVPDHARASTNVCIDIRRTSRDSRPPRRVLTAALMGDPKPGRSAQDQYEGMVR